ncbi:MAG: 4Fe-4S dicluster domain-containing protein [Archaeoglobaceae archaeon]
MISRRKFLILAGASAIATMLPLQISAKSVKGEKSRRWGMIADIEKCTECMEELIRRSGNKEVKPPCVVACDRENNVPEFEEKSIDPQWIRIAKFRSKYGDEFYAPLLCNHCENPPCAQVCLTQATFKRGDGVVEVDMHRCIGCRYCMIACPYGSRSYNFRDPREGLREVNPRVPMRTKGVVEKCTFCVHRIDDAISKGKDPEPACVEACRLFGKNSLVFGNVNDENSEILRLLKNNTVIQLRAELGTEPHVYYLPKR